MARIPGADWNPIDPQFVPSARLAVVNRVNLHVAVSEARSIRPIFNRTGAASSHAYTRKDGTTEQYIDTALRAEADLDGNDATISIETQGGLHGPQTEPWTPEQVEELARIFAWAVRTHGVPAKLATSSKPGIESQGLSWHRLGIDGNFPAAPDLRAGRLQRGGGMRYSNSRGKLCPGDAKIAQIPGILARALELLGGAPAAAPVSSTPTVAAPAPTQAARTNHYGRPLLSVDGRRGPATIAEWQRQMGTPSDGVISRPSSLIKAWQRKLKAAGKYTGRIDGIEGALTIRGTQRYLGTPVDGVISVPSVMVEVLQRRLNAGTI